MSPQSLQDFEQLLLSTGLVQPAQLQEALGHIQRRTGGAPGDCLTLARQLGRMGLITAWQNHKLLSGDKDGYFFGSCKFLAHIHTGLTGEVYQAHRTSNPQSQLALKVLAPPWSTSHRQLAELLDQVEQVAEFDHPHLVRVQSLETEGALVAITSELVDGAAATRRIAGERALECERAAEIIRQVATALSSLHEAGLVHGRLGPGKLVIDSQDNIKLLDPGLSILAEVAFTEQIQGREPELVDCIAPEQAIDPTCMTPAVDLYALGCCFHALLCGKVPYPDGDLNQRLFARQHGAPPDIRTRRGDVPEELADLCSRLLARRPQDRPASAEQVQIELEQILTDLMPPGESQDWGEGSADDSGLTQMVAESSAISDEAAEIVVDPETGETESLSDSHVLTAAADADSESASDTFIGSHHSDVVEAVSLEIAGEEDNGSGVMETLDFPAMDDPNTPTTLASLSDISREDQEVKLVTREDKAQTGESISIDLPADDGQWSESDIEGPVTEDSQADFALDELGSHEDSGTLTASHSAIRRAGRDGVHLETPEDDHALTAHNEDPDDDATPEIYTEFEESTSDSGTVTGSLSDIRRAGQDAIELETGSSPKLVPPESTAPFDSGPIVISQELNEVGDHGGTVTGSLSDIQKAGQDSISLITAGDHDTPDKPEPPETPDSSPIVIMQELEGIGDHAGTVMGSHSDIQRAGQDAISLTTPSEDVAPNAPVPYDSSPIVISQELNDVGQYGGTVTGSLSDIKRAEDDPIAMELGSEASAEAQPLDPNAPIVIGQELNEIGNYTGTVMGSHSDITRASDEAIHLETATDDPPSADPMSLPELEGDSPSFSDLAESDEPVEAVSADATDGNAPVAAAANSAAPVPVHSAGDDDNLHFGESTQESETPTEVRRTRAKMNEMLRSFGQDDASDANLPRVEPTAEPINVGEESYEAEESYESDSLADDDSLIDEPLDDASLDGDTTVGDSFAFRARTESPTSIPENAAPTFDAPTLQETFGGSRSDDEAASSLARDDAPTPTPVVNQLPEDDEQPTTDTTSSPWSDTVEASAPTEAPSDEADADTLDLPAVTTDTPDGQRAETGSVEPEQPATEPTPSTPEPKVPEPSIPVPASPPRTASRRVTSPWDQSLALAESQPAIAMTWGTRASAAFGLFAILTIAVFVVTALTVGAVKLANQLSELLLVFGTLGVIVLALGIAARPGANSHRRH